ncbi:MAG: thiamine phosphate synthase [Magnetococcales bacterium]|nr:thiamine phosphate synthase [Magnetococcales bacterium]
MIPGVSALGIYPILDATFLAGRGVDPEEAAARLGDSGVSLVQLRCKGSGGEFWSFAEGWMGALRRLAPRVRVIVNDRVDLALALEADGVHVGQGDLPVTACRRLMGPGRIVGLSTHSAEEVLRAEGAVGEGRPDYVGFGPVYGTTTKADALSRRGVALLREACGLTALPVAAIGGIRPEHWGELKQAGASGAAMIGGLWGGDWHHALDQAKAW